MQPNKKSWPTQASYKFTSVCSQHAGRATLHPSKTQTSKRGALACLGLILLFVVTSLDRWVAPFENHQRLILIQAHRLAHLHYLLLQSTASNWFIRIKNFSPRRKTSVSLCLYWNKWPLHLTCAYRCRKVARSVEKWVFVVISPSFFRSTGILVDFALF